MLVSGTQTPNCVRATAFDAFQYGYRTILLENCTSSANPQVQKANLDDLEKAGIERISDFQDLCWRADK
ncbi:isochorismatase family protein [Allobaculum sp. Allo2]|nr:isochorismatase family protein [Allobaculum sp. Allo2]